MSFSTSLPPNIEENSSPAAYVKSKTSTQGLDWVLINIDMDEPSFASYDTYVRRGWDLITCSSVLITITYLK